MIENAVSAPFKFMILLLPSVVYIRILLIVFLFIGFYVIRLGSNVKLYDALNTDVLKL